MYTSHSKLTRTSSSGGLGSSTNRGGSNGSLNSSGGLSSSGGLGNSTFSQHLREAMTMLLNQREQREFTQIISLYRERGDVDDLTSRLLLLLDTPAKCQLMLLLRKLIPASDLADYDRLTQQGIVPLVPGKQGASGYGRTTSVSETPFRGDQKRSSFRQRTGSEQETNNNNNSILSKNADSSSVTNDYDDNQQQTANQVTETASSLVTSQQDEIATLAEALPLRNIYMEQMGPRQKTGLGFYIRGGKEHGTGIFVSYVDTGSVAQKQGLVAGDQIVSVNGISFDKITHDEAAEIIRSCKVLEMDVRSVGRVPGSFESQQLYMWLDPSGRPVSPPTLNYRQSATSKSRRGEISLNYGDERKVNVFVSTGRELGINIRGGKELGLGIYVTAVDKGSVADSVGIKTGDQIIDVNGTSFMDISHGAAVSTLKSTNRFIITLRWIGKLPHSKTSYSQTRWVVDQSSSTTASKQQTPLPVRSTEAKTVQKESNSPAVERRFQKGAGSQLMHTSLTTPIPLRTLLDEKAKSILTEDEYQAFSYNITEYLNEHLTVDGLCCLLAQVFNTNEKFSLSKEMRPIIRVKDIEKFDKLIAEIDIIDSDTVERTTTRRLAKVASSQDLFGNKTSSSPLNRKSRIMDASNSNEDRGRYDNNNSNSIVTVAAEIHSLPSESSGDQEVSSDSGINLTSERNRSTPVIGKVMGPTVISSYIDNNRSTNNHSDTQRQKQSFHNSDETKKLVDDTQLYTATFKQSSSAANRNDQSTSRDALQSDTGKQLLASKSGTSPLPSKRITNGDVLKQNNQKTESKSSNNWMLAPNNVSMMSSNESLNRIDRENTPSVTNSRTNSFSVTKTESPIISKESALPVDNKQPNKVALINQPPQTTASGKKSVRGDKKISNIAPLIIEDSSSDKISVGDISSESTAVQSNTFNKALSYKDIINPSLLHIDETMFPPPSSRKNSLSPILLHTRASSPVMSHKDSSSSLLSLPQDSVSPLASRKNSEIPLLNQKTSASPLSNRKTSDNIVASRKNSAGSLLSHNEAPNPLILSKDSASPLHLRKNSISSSLSKSSSSSSLYNADKFGRNSTNNLPNGNLPATKQTHKEILGNVSVPTEYTTINKSNALLKPLSRDSTIANGRLSPLACDVKTPASSEQTSPSSNISNSSRQSTPSIDIKIPSHKHNGDEKRMTQIHEEFTPTEDELNVMVTDGRLMILAETLSLASQTTEDVLNEAEEAIEYLNNELLGYSAADDTLSDDHIGDDHTIEDHTIDDHQVVTDQDANTSDEISIGSEEESDEYHNTLYPEEELVLKSNFYSRNGIDFRSSQATKPAEVLTNEGEIYVQEKNSSRTLEQNKNDIYKPAITQRSLYDRDEASLKQLAASINNLPPVTKFLNSSDNIEARIADVNSYETPVNEYNKKMFSYNPVKTIKKSKSVSNVLEIQSERNYSIADESRFNSDAENRGLPTAGKDLDISDNDHGSLALVKPKVIQNVDNFLTNQTLYKFNDLAEFSNEFTSESSNKYLADVSQLMGITSKSASTESAIIDYDSKKRKNPLHNVKDADELEQLASKNKVEKMKIMFDNAEDQQRATENRWASRNNKAIVYKNESEDKQKAADLVQIKKDKRIEIKDDEKKQYPNDDFILNNKSQLETNRAKNTSETVQRLNIIGDITTKSKQKIASDLAMEAKQKLANDNNRARQQNDDKLLHEDNTLQMTKLATTNKILPHSDNDNSEIFYHTTEKNVTKMVRKEQSVSEIQETKLSLDTQPFFNHLSIFNSSFTSNKKKNILDARLNDSIAVHRGKQRVEQVEADLKKYNSVPYNAAAKIAEQSNGVKTQQSNWIIKKDNDFRTSTLNTQNYEVTNEQKIPFDFLPNGDEDNTSDSDVSEHYITRHVIIPKIRPTLGMSIEGGAKTREPLPRVYDIQENGCAAQCSELKVGDVIMAVCGRSLVGLDHKDCVKVIAKAFRDKAIPYLDLTIAVENIS